MTKGIKVKGLWFNPNIHPYTEYTSRLESLKKLGKLWSLDIEYIDSYPLDDFLKSIVDKGAARCEVCYRTRLQKAAETAAKMDFEAFTTSLIASPFQKFDMIVDIGKEIGLSLGVPFYYEDLRQGWGISRGLAAEFGLYRQKYCGCIYSEMERYSEKGGKGRNKQRKTG